MSSGSWSVLSQNGRLWWVRVYCVCHNNNNNIIFNVHIVNNIIESEARGSPGGEDRQVREWRNNKFLSLT